MEMTNFAVVREVLRSNYRPRNLTGDYHFWVISPGNSSPDRFWPGGARGRGTRPVVNLVRPLALAPTACKRRKAGRGVGTRLIVVNDVHAYVRWLA